MACDIRDSHDEQLQKLKEEFPSQVYRAYMVYDGADYGEWRIFVQLCRGLKRVDSDEHMFYVISEKQFRYVMEHLVVPCGCSTCGVCVPSSANIQMSTAVRNTHLGIVDPPAKASYVCEKCGHCTTVQTGAHDLYSSPGINIHLRASNFTAILDNICPKCITRMVQDTCGIMVRVE